VPRLVRSTPPGRLPRGGPDFSLPAAPGLRLGAGAAVRLFPGLSLARLSFSAVVCVSLVAFSLSFPAFGAQSSATSASSQRVAKKKKTTSAKTRRQLAPEPARIKEIQQALAREGFYQGDPTGKWDDATVAAMKNFQQSKGLQPTGKIEALSLQKLGLGSPVAGLAPPASQTPAASTPAPSDPAKKP